ncbi:fibronectin type III domain-containing protein [Lactococcus petauri]|nr:hypothetical protein YA68_08725 [Lactococcus garvieae]
MADNNYLHTAYAKSADGTDGFTTVYPNLNLLTDSKDFKNKNKQGINLTTSITSPVSTILVENNESYLNFVKTDGKPRDWFAAFLKPDNIFTNTPKLNILSNTQYTFSFLAKGSGEHIIFAYSSWVSIPSSGRLIINLTDKWTLYTFTVTSVTSIPNKNVQFIIRSETVGSEINLKYPKVELGSTATPYMQSASEVTTDDWPKYVGTYVDTNPVSSTDPSKYGWDEMKYRVYLDGIAVAGSKLLSTKVENLKPDTSYTIQVKQVSGEEESDFSDSVTFKTNVQK